MLLPEPGSGRDEGKPLLSIKETFQPENPAQSPWHCEDLLGELGYHSQSIFLCFVDTFQLWHFNDKSKLVLDTKLPSPTIIFFSTEFVSKNREINL